MFVYLPCGVTGGSNRSVIKKMFFLTCAFGIFLALNSAVCSDETEEFKEYLREQEKLLVLFTEECCSCVECVETEVLLGAMSPQIEDTLNLPIVKLKKTDMRKSYGIRTVPSLVFIRNGKPIQFDGQFEMEVLFTWLQENQERTTADLDDHSFEHLTQAATGATTGDWLVAFYNTACAKESHIIMNMEGAGSHLRNRVNVALVDIQKSPDLVKRFNIKKCPEIIFFRLGKMYRYSLSETSPLALKRFAEGFHRNSKSESVPAPKSPFDKFVEEVIENIRQYMFELTVFMITLTLVVIFIVILSVLKKAPEKKKEE